MPQTIKTRRKGAKQPKLAASRMGCFSRYLAVESSPSPRPTYLRTHAFRQADESAAAPGDPVGAVESLLLDEGVAAEPKGTEDSAFNRIDVGNPADAVVPARTADSDVDVGSAFADVNAEGPVVAATLDPQAFSDLGVLLEAGAWSWDEEKKPPWDDTNLDKVSLRRLSFVGSRKNVRVREKTGLGSNCKVGKLSTTVNRDGRPRITLQLLSHSRNSRDAPSCLCLLFLPIDVLSCTFSLSNIAAPFSCPGRPLAAAVAS